MENQSFIDSILQKRWLTHVLFWSGLFILFAVLASLNSGTVKPHLILQLATLPSQMAAAYLLNYYQIPQLLYKKKYVLFAASLLLSIYAFSAWGRISVVYLAEPFIRTNFEQETIKEILSDTAYLFSVYFASTYVFAFIMTLIRAVKLRYEEKHKIEILQKEKATNELKFLKGQIQPHFLFNTLNNLYALTLAKSDLAPKVVMKLSELLDFILYQSNQESIPISKEIELIQGFIDLETLRYGDKISVDFTHTIQNNNTQISPLLLLPLVENAFKHGASGSADTSKITIDLKVNTDQLYFEIYNTKPQTVASKSLTGSGIGTSNLKRQLEFNYPKRYTLEIDETSEDYLVKLQVELNTVVHD